MGLNLDGMKKTEVVLTREQASMLYRDASGGLKQMLESLYPDIATWSDVQVTAYEQDFEMTKCVCGVKVVAGDCAFVVLDLPDFIADFKAATVISEAVGGKLPTKEMLQLMHDYQKEINSLLVHKLEGPAYWSSTPHRDRGVYVCQWHHWIWRSGNPHNGLTYCVRPVLPLSLE